MEPSYYEMEALLMDCSLLSRKEGLSEEQVVGHYNALSKCVFGEVVGEESQHYFLHHLLPCKARLVVKLTNIS